MYPMKIVATLVLLCCSLHAYAQSPAPDYFVANCFNCLDIRDSLVAVVLIGSGWARSRASANAGIVVCWVGLRSHDGCVRSEIFLPQVCDALNQRSRSSVLASCKR